VKVRAAFAILCALIVVAASAFFIGRYADSKPSNRTSTTIASAGPPLLMLTYCKVGTYSFPTEDGNGPDQSFAGEVLTVMDNWNDKSDVEVVSLVVVFYDKSTEVGSILASANGNTESSSGASAYVNALNPSPVYLTPGQSQSWTLPAGWTGSANRCTVVKLNTSPQVPRSQIGQYN
jgi:hypothetical protein